MGCVTRMAGERVDRRIVGEWSEDVRACSMYKTPPPVLLVDELKRNKSRASVHPRRRSCAGRENSVSPLHCLPPFVRASEEEEGAAEMLHQQSQASDHHGSPQDMTAETQP